MTTETTIILLTFALALVNYILPVFWIAAKVGTTTLAGSRDNVEPSDNVVGQRARRATENFKETLPWAIGLLILVQVTDDANGTTALGGWVYFISRVIYVPAYLSGIPYVRSLAWTASIVGLIMIALQLM